MSGKGRASTDEIYPPHGHVPYPREPELDPDDLDTEQLNRAIDRYNENPDTPRVVYPEENPDADIYYTMDTHRASNLGGSIFNNFMISPPRSPDRNTIRIHAIDPTLNFLHRPRLKRPPRHIPIHPDKKKRR